MGRSTSLRTGRLDSPRRVRPLPVSMPRVQSAWPRDGPVSFEQQDKSITTMIEPPSSPTCCSMCREPGATPASKAEDPLSQLVGAAGGSAKWLGKVVDAVRSAVAPTVRFRVTAAAIRRDHEPRVWNPDPAPSSRRMRTRPRAPCRRSPETITRPSATRQHPTATRRARSGESSSESWTPRAARHSRRSHSRSP